MFTVHRPLFTSVRNVLLVFLLLLFSGEALSRDTAVVVPTHATPTNYGKEWECNQGFRDAGDSCDPALVPENAYPTNARYGTGWKCERGYKAHIGACRSVKVPPNGYLNDSGDGWQCAQNYKRTRDTCKLRQEVHR